MSENLSWVFKLIDQVSGPARRIQNALGGVRRATAPVFARLGGMGKLLGEAWGDIGGTVVKGLKGAGAGFLQAGGVFLGVGAAAAGLGVVGAKWAADSLSFQENSMLAFETILGSKEAAKRVMDQAIAFSAATPFETKDVVENTKRLLVAGFKETEIPIVMAGVGDIGALSGLEKQDQAINAFQKIMAQGKLTGESIQMLGDAGVNVGKVYEALGGTVAKGQAMIASGAVSSKAGITAALEVIRTTLSGGELGGLMAKQSKSLTGIWSSLMSRPFELLISADAGGATSGIKSFLQTVTNVLDPAGPTGKRVVGLFNVIGSAFGGMFGGGKGPGVESVLNGILNVVEPLVKGVSAFGAAFMGGMGAALKPLMDIFIMMGTGQGSTDMLVEALKMFGRTLGWIAGVLVIGFGALFSYWALLGIAVGAIGTAVEWVWGKLTGFFDFVLGIGAKFIDVGKQIVDGLWQGLTGNWAGMIERFGGLVSMLPASVKSLLGIASPSRVFMDLGMQTTAGFEAGIDASGPQSALEAMVSPPVAAGQIGAGFSSSTTTNAPSISIQIDASNMPKGDAETVGSILADRLEAQLATVFERIAEGAGA
jgi:hypothetical protein